MLTDTLIALFDRDLQRLATEIALYRHESNIWKVGGHVTNSAGNLCLHLVGNLNTFIGQALGNTGYVRNREHEFSAKGIPREQLITMVNNTMAIVRTTLEGLQPQQLLAEFPVKVFEQKTTTEYMLVHLATHLSYHLGQVNYHRRLMDIGEVAV